MSKHVQDHIQEARRFLLTSDHAEEAKDFYGLLLDAAATSVNGVEDRPKANAMTLGLLTVAFVKHCVRSEAARAPTGATGVWRNVYPYRWPACVFFSVASFSHNFELILSAVLKAVGRG